MTWLHPQPQFPRRQRQQADVRARHLRGRRRVRPLARLRRFRKVKLNEKHWSGGADVYETQVGDCCVWVSLTGMGIKSFDFKSATCLRSAGLDAIISSGLCGGLNTRYRVGQIVVPKRVATTARLRRPRNRRTR